jgi:hypothetical protein
VRIFCHDCRQKISLTGKEQKADELLRDHLNRNSYRILEDDYGISKNTACTVVNAAAASLIHSNELTKLMQPQNYCGCILVDGKFVPVKEVKHHKEGAVPKPAKRLRHRVQGGLTIVPFVDYLTHDIPVHVIASSENMDEVREGYKLLYEIGYPLRIVVSDERMAHIALCAKEFNPDVIIQYCLKHYTEAIYRTLKIQGVKRSIAALQKKLNAIGDDVLVVSRPYAVRRARTLVNQIADLEYEYGYLMEFQDLLLDILWSTETEKVLKQKESELHAAILHMNLKSYPYKSRILDRYQDYLNKREHLTAFLRYPDLDIPRTTNLIEGMNSTTFEMRFASIRGFEKEETTDAYVNAMILKHRFHIFKDCRGKFKHLNGKSPLEIAEPKNLFGFRFGLDNWIQFCRDIKKRPPN